MGKHKQERNKYTNIYGEGKRNYEKDIVDYCKI